jgi:hypothetical protein
MPIIGSLGGGSAGGFGQRKGGLPPLAVDFLVVAGGGSGANNFHGAGAGAGGYRTSFPGGTKVEIAAGDNTITVGTGGTGNNGSYNPGNPGNPSSIVGLETIESAGGGAGRHTGAVDPVGFGGSGGGGYYTGYGLGNVPPVSPPQGNPGGGWGNGGNNNGPISWPPEALESIVVEAEADH